MPADCNHVVVRQSGAPEQVILPILQRFASHRVRLVARRDGLMLRDCTYSVPESRSAINRQFRSLAYWHWMRDSDVPLLEVGDVVTVLFASVLTARVRPQAFAHGVTHCLFEPIRKWCVEKLRGAATARTRRRYELLRKKVEEYAHKYRHGCPEDAIHQVADDLQVDISVELPLASDESRIFLNARSQKKSLRSFRFVNTRWDHVELNEITTHDEGAAKECTRQELSQRVSELDAQRVFYTFSKDSHGISSACTRSTASAARNRSIGVARLKI